MANSILKLRIDDQEYNAKLKNAVQGLQHLNEVAHKGAGELTGLEKSEVDFIKALGDMETKSRSAAGKTRELESAFKELKVIYDNLNEVEKADEGGKALVKSLDTLKQRAQEARARLNEATEALKNSTEAEKESGTVLDQLSQKFTINFDAVKLFNTALKAADGAMQVAKDAFFASESTVDEWGRTVEASRSLYEGFLTALNNSDISGYLTRMDQIVEAARAAYNELDRLGTMKTIQGPAMSAQQAENDRMRQMIMTGRYIAPVDGRNAAPGMVNGQRLTAEQIRAIERNLQGGMQKIVTLVGNEVKQTSKAIDARYSLMAKENGMTLKEFRQGTSSMAEFDKRIKAAAEYDKYERAHTTTSTRINPTSGDAETVILRDNTKNPYEAYKNWGTFRVDKMGQGSYNDLVNLIRQRDQQAAQAYSMQSQAYRTINRAEGTTVRDIMNGKTGGTGGGTGGSRSLSTPEQADAKYVQAQKDYEQSLQQAALEVKAGTINSAEAKKKELQAAETLWKSIGDAREVYDSPKLKEAQAKVEERIVALGPEVDKAIEAQKDAEKAARELANAQKKLADAQNELADAQASGDLKKIYAAEKKVETAQVQVDARTSTSTGEQKAVEVPITISNLDAVKQKMTEEIATTPVGDSLLQNMQEAFSDASAIGSIFSTAVKNGIDTATFDTTGIMEKLLKREDISDETIQGYVDQLNALLKTKFDETEWPKVAIAFDVQTKEITTVAKQQQQEAQKMAKDWQAAGSAIQQVGAAMNAIQDPAAKVMGTIAQAIGSVALGAGQAIQNASSMGPWAWIAFAAAATATMITTINSIHSATGYAEGGIVDGSKGGFVQGNTYSGDQVGNVRLNAGELVLNKSQMNNLANALEGGGLESMSLSTVITAEDIKLILNNNGERIGVGEYFKM